MKESARFYSENARLLAEQYDSVRAEDVHACWLQYLPSTKALVLDVGAGSGRDAAWFASQGHEVVAVEPAVNLREEGRRRHPEAAIRWLDDSLPGLKGVERLRFKFDLILVSGVWMHVAVGDRERAFRKLANLLKPGGKLVFSLRGGEPPAGRVAYPTSVDELRSLASRHLLETRLKADQPDLCGRQEVEWHTVVFELRDDGTGALPLLRHIIVNDAKSSTYKLALLRVLARIADGSPGLVLARDEEFVTLPFGLVALYWVRTFMPLLSNAIFQQQGNPDAAPSFAGEAFSSLGGVAAAELRPGALFRGGDATNLSTAIREARNTIKKMPAFYTTFPNSDSPVFPCEIKPTRARSPLTLDREYFEALGTFKVPTTIWDALSQYACWIEPAIIGEWATTMRNYERAGERERPLGDYLEALRWPEYQHDTGEVRKMVEGLRLGGTAIYCAWSGSRLSGDFAIDHALPFARWPNNDLWNLLPASPTVNGSKGDKLVSAERLGKSRDAILEWWRVAYEREALVGRFRSEAVASLSGIGALDDEPEAEVIFGGLQNQRIRLKVNQQLAEWDWR